MMTVSMEAQFNEQAGFQISNAVRCFWRTWSARSPDLAVPDNFLWGCVSKAKYIKHVLPILMRECIQGIPKEMLQRVMTSFPRRR
jgi:hypothetical protein